MWWWGIAIGVLLCVWLLSADRPSWEDDLERIKTRHGRAFKKHCFFAKVGWYRRSQQRLWYVSWALFSLLALFFLWMRIQGWVTRSWPSTVYYTGILAMMPLIIWGVCRWRYIKRMRYAWLICIRLFSAFFLVGLTVQQVLDLLYPITKSYYPVLEKPLSVLIAELTLTADASFAWERFRQRLSIPKILEVTYMLEDSALMGMGTAQLLQNALESQGAQLIDLLEMQTGVQSIILSVCILLLFLFTVFLMVLLVMMPDIISLLSNLSSVLGGPLDAT